MYLDKGLGFVETKIGNIEDIKFDAKDFLRKLGWKIHFKNNIPQLDDVDEQVVDDAHASLRIPSRNHPPPDKMPASYRKRNQEREWSAKELEESMAEAKARGLPPGWTVVWDPAKRCRMWISPDGRRRCNGLPKAIAWSVKNDLLPASKMPSSYKRNPKANRVLTDEEVETSLKEAKARKEQK